MNVQEDASYRARYHPAKMPAEAPRTFSFNTGRCSDGRVDWGHNLRLCGLEAMEVIALADPTNPQSMGQATQQIRTMSANARALITRTCVFRVSHKLYHESSRLQKSKANKQSIAEKMKASQSCLLHMRT